jgi:hypothetical protein
LGISILIDFVRRAVNPHPGSSILQRFTTTPSRPSPQTQFIQDVMGEAVEETRATLDWL